MNVSVKLFLEDHEKYVLGPGRIELLRYVETLGSLRKAAQKLGMSYRWAWGRLNDAEKSLGFALLAKNDSQKGAAKTLTAEARELLAWYDGMEEKMSVLLKQAIADKPSCLRKAGPGTPQKPPQRNKLD